MRDLSYTKSITALYVEDESIIRDVYSRILKKFVKELFIASNGEEGLQVFKEKHPDIVITDIKMPKIDGIEMSKKIKELSPNIPIIFTTAFNNNDYLLEAIKLHSTAYILKPIDAQELESEIKTVSKSLIQDKINKLQNSTIEKQKEILQSIINLQKQLLFIVDDKHLEFANSAFLKFFQVKDIEEFNKKYGMVCNHIKKDNIPLSKTCEDDDFYEYIKTIDSKKEMVSINDNFFYIDIFLIKKGAGVYLIILNDITQIKQEKEKLEQLANYDKLTKIYNRHKLYELANIEQNRAIRYNEPLSIAILDIDDFKKINDSFGHNKGDEILQTLANMVHNHIRSVDIFARWGGEEFIIIFTNTDLENAFKSCENIRLIISNYKDNLIDKFTISIGLSTFNPNLSLEQNIKNCDKALYKAKSNGKNQTSIYKGDENE